MEDTESSDFLSSSGSFYSSFSAGSASNIQEEQNRFGVFLSDSLTETAKAEEEEDGYESVRMIPNSRLSSADHPVLIRLENEYQARRSPWYRRTEQYCAYPEDPQRRAPCPNKNKRPNSQPSSDQHPVLVRLENEYQARRSVWLHHAGQYARYTPEKEGRASCPSKNKLVRGGSPARNRDKPLMDLTFPDEANMETAQGLKRQRENVSPSHWWRERKEQSLPLSDGDRVFAQKCRELQGFIKPLTELLNGLKRGKFDRGLSTFQQSLAMDRIQRIVGVLQKPEMGERYLSTLLQVEMMLKVWFPGVTSSSSSSSSEPDMQEPQNKVAKHPENQEARSCPIQAPPCLARSRPSGNTGAPAAHSDCVCCKDGVQVLAEWPAMNLTWMHTSPISNPPVSPVDLHHLNAVLGQDLFGAGGSSCGIVFLVQSSQASTTLSSLSSGSEESPLDGGTPEPRPPRSRSAPPKTLLPELEKLKSQSHSLPYLSACVPTSGGENT